MYSPSVQVGLYVSLTDIDPGWIQSDQGLARNRPVPDYRQNRDIASVLAILS